MTRKPSNAYATIGKFTISGDELDFTRRRVRPFLGGSGETVPLIDLLANAYLQGLIDAAEVVAIKAERAS